MNQDDKMEYPEIDTHIFGELMFFSGKCLLGCAKQGCENKQQVHLLAFSLRRDQFAP